MDVAMIGLGYVGLVTAGCLAQAGNRVTCIDKDENKIATLQCGRAPFFEPGLEELIQRGVSTGNITFHTNLAQGTRGAAIVFLAIGTPTTSNGHVHLADIMECASALARLLTQDTVIVMKSTVPVGTCERIQAILNDRCNDIHSPRLVVASNPEFLAEGRAVKDFQCPERIVVGCADSKSCRLLRTLYRPFDPTGDRFLSMDLQSAEFAKYACNAMLAARISMVNELAGIAGQLSIDMRAVCNVLKTDPRIGPYYLQPGAGYGGSCLPKDLRALIAMAQENGEPASMLHSIAQVNDRQSQLLFERISACLSDDLQGRCIALWGLSFKPGTDDLREAPSLTLIKALIGAGARVQAYDPAAGMTAQALSRQAGFELAPDTYAACDNADVLVVITDWEEFQSPDFGLIARKLSTATVFDYRNMYDTHVLRQHGLIHVQPGQPVLPVARHMLGIAGNAI